MALKKVADVERDGETYTIYKGGFVSVCNPEGQVMFAVMPNESLIIDKYFRAMEPVADNIAKDFQDGKGQPRNANIRGFGPNNKG